MRSRLPIYEQVVERIKELIIQKVLKPDEQLPSVRVLASQLTINPNTIQKAYNELENQGYIYSVKGKGNFVSGAIPNPNSEKMERLKADLRKISSELLFLGMSKEEIVRNIEEIEVKGGMPGAADERSDQKVR
ncbi:MAG: GntR family transcriptional regulator [Chitinophagales bacterium]